MARSRCRWEPPNDWSQWSEYLAAGLHARNRWRLPVLLIGMLLANGRRTVTTWLRAAGVSADFADYYYFLGSLGRKTECVATPLLALLLRHLPLPQRVLAVIDDSPTKRYGPQVEGADVHRNPTPGPADQEYVYGHIWVTLSLAVRHPQWGPLALPLRAWLYVRQKTLDKIPQPRGWKFATKLVLAAQLVEWLGRIVQQAGKTLWIVVDGGYTKRPFLKRALTARVTIVGRLRKDAALRDLPPRLRPGQRRGRGRPRKFGRHKISLAKRAGQKRGWQTVVCTVYGKQQTKTCKTFLATYRPAGGVIRVVVVREEHGWFAFFCTDPNASVAEIIEAYADRATIEQGFHDIKEVWGAGQQQLRNIWANLAAFNLNLWIYTLVELWAWNKTPHDLVDRSDSPWDTTDRRPSHADRRKALRQQVLRNELSKLNADARWSRKISRLAEYLMDMAT